MKLDQILKDIDMARVSGETDIDITGISYDSRKVKKGHLFVAIKGEHADGHDFIADAVNKGALALVCESSEQSPSFAKALREQTTGAGVVIVQVSDSRTALASIANNYYGNPSGLLSVVGITGTNGKTTTSYIMKSVLESWGRKVGLVGTIQYMIDDKAFDARYTTPEALEFQELLNRMLESGCTHVISEISSHALAQKRVDRTSFASAVFTNLTREHLDFHETMENYFKTKERLFTQLLDKDGAAVINIDDVYGRRLVTELSSGQRKILTYGLETGADLTATDINNSFLGLRFCIVMRGRKYSVDSQLVGLPNVYNILSAAAASYSLGVPWDVILDGIKNAGTVKGRFEKVDAGQGFLAVVDYAHTEDALERLIYTARGLSAGRIITVFGCGGDRDRGKRAVMGALATRLSDFVIITSDNPRSEKPEDIMKEIEAGAVRRNYLIEPDRREAIKRAVLMAGDNDIVLVAGKGHENYQEIRGERVRFSDREVLEEAIKQLIKN